MKSRECNYLMTQCDCKLMTLSDCAAAWLPGLAVHQPLASRTRRQRPVARETSDTQPGVTSGHCIVIRREVFIAAETTVTVISFLEHT